MVTNFPLRTAPDPKPQALQYHCQASPIARSTLVRPPTAFRLCVGLVLFLPLPLRIPRPCDPSPSSRLPLSHRTVVPGGSALLRFPSSVPHPVLFTRLIPSTTYLTPQPHPPEVPPNLALPLGPHPTPRPSSSPVDAIPSYIIRLPQISSPDPRSSLSDPPLSDESLRQITLPPMTRSPLRECTMSLR